MGGEIVEVSLPSDEDRSNSQSKIECHRPVLTGMLGERAAAYEQQCWLHGGLSLPQQKALKAVLQSVDHTSSGKEKRRAEPPRGHLPFAVGTEFIREWKGREHIVVMTSDGLLWSGQTFKSLSAVAHAITGTKWNGYRFFGVERKRGEQS